MTGDVSPASGLWSATSVLACKENIESPSANTSMVCNFPGTIPVNVQLNDVAATGRTFLLFKSANSIPLELQES